MTGDFEKQTTPSLYWATIGYAESWWTIDADNLKRIETLGGQLTVHILECIAREYNVIRGLAPKKRECLQGILNTAAEHWPVEKPNGEENLLIERACQCTKIMETAQRKGCFTQRNGIPTNQISAITKFMWFLRPENWTLYDKFASDGLVCVRPERLIECTCTTSSYQTGNLDKPCLGCSKISTEYPASAKPCLEIDAFLPHALLTAS